MTRHLAIIGAGAGGLAAAKYLIARGCEVTIFEIGSQIGGLWVYDNDSGMSPAYRSLHINSEARVSCFVDHPFPDDAPLYPNHGYMHDYLKSYAEKFDLVRKVRFNCSVVRVEPLAEGGYTVSASDGSDQRFDGVVVASGHQSTPKHPAGLDGFTGDYIHAHAYRVPEPYAGKQVLVIGPGNSGVDIAADVSSVAAKTFLSARSPVLIMPRMMFGVPNSRTLVRLEKPWLPWQIRIRIRTALTRIFHGRMEQWGFRTPKTRTHPISHPTLISLIAWDRVRAKPGIAQVDGKAVSFVDGTTETIDAIIAATGYTTDFPFLPDALSPKAGPMMNLYNRTVHPDHPGLYFIGFFDVSGGSNIRMMDDQAQYIAAVASGAVTLPDAGAVRSAIESDHDWNRSQFPDSPRYGLELDPRRYRKALARDYARSGVTPARTI